jgi:hypothetical protein
MLKRRAGKNSWSRPLAEFVAAVIDPVVLRQGFGQSNLILFWDDIAGERLAANSQPVKMQWPARGRDGATGSASATLIIRVESGFALELQHLAPVLIERVNAHFGWRCVSRIVLKQGPITEKPPARPVASPPSKAAEMAAEKLVGTALEEPLRQALTRLGARVLSAS